MSLNRLLQLQKAKPQDASGGGLPIHPAAAKQEPESESLTSPEDKTPAPAPNPKALPFGKMVPKPTPKPVETPAKPAVEFDLDNLGNFDVSSIDETETLDSTEFAGFFDEIEATAPDRDLPEEMTPGMLGFVESLDSIYGYLNDTDMFGQSVRTIMMELQENPEYDKLISDTDVHVMIRAMRNTMGLARVRKQQKQRKTGGVSKSRSPSKKQALMDKALGLTVSMDIGID